jgi:hypothetical protein
MRAETFVGLQCKASVIVVRFKSKLEDFPKPNLMQISSAVLELQHAEKTDRKAW